MNINLIRIELNKIKKIRLKIVFKFNSQLWRKQKQLTIIDHKSWSKIHLKNI